MSDYPVSQEDTPEGVEAVESIHGCEGCYYNNKPIKEQKCAEVYCYGVIYKEQNILSKINK